MEQLDDDIWVVEGPRVDFYSFAYSTRMVIIRLSDRRLWIWSPIALDEDLAREVCALGTPAFLVAPNPIHHLFLANWHERFPEAQIWAPKSLRRKEPELHFDGILDDRAPAGWAQEIDQFYFDNSPLLDEVVFFHRASRTAIFADLTENFSNGFIRKYWRWWQRPIARMWKIVEGWGYAPLELRLTFRHKQQARAKIRQIKSLEPQRVIMAHGEIIRSDGVKFLNTAFAWLDPGSVRSQAAGCAR